MAWKPDYVSASDLKTEILKTSSTTDDLWLARCVTAASRAIDRHTGRQFGRAAALETRYYQATWRTERQRWVAPIDDLMSSADLVVTVDGSAVTGPVLLPRNAAANGRPWTHVQLPEGTWPTDTEVSVYERFGWTAVPATVGAAALLQAGRFYVRKDSLFGIAGSPELGNELRLLQKVDADVGVMLTDYVRAGGVA